MRQCRRTGKHEHDGKWFCSAHHPPSVTEKQTTKMAAWDAKRAQKRREEKLLGLAPEMLTLLRYLYKEDAGYGDDVWDEVAALLARADKEGL